MRIDVSSGVALGSTIGLLAGVPQLLSGPGLSTLATLGVLASSALGALAGGLLARQRLQLHRLRAAERRAACASVARSRFLSGMSHDLRTPLNAVIGFAEMISLDPAAPARTSEYAGHIQCAGAELLERLVGLLAEAERASEPTPAGMAASTTPAAGGRMAKRIPLPAV